MSNNPANSYQIESFAHSPHIIPGASQQAAGVMSAADKAKLDSLAPGSGLNEIVLRQPGLPPSGNTIQVSVTLLDPNGNPLAEAAFASVESFAQVNGRGAITTVSGTEIMNTGAPAGKLSSAIIRAQNDGTFQFTITDLHGSGDTVVVRVMIDDNAVPAFIELFWPGL